MVANSDEHVDCCGLGFRVRVRVLKGYAQRPKSFHNFEAHGQSLLGLREMLVLLLLVASCVNTTIYSCP